MFIRRFMFALVCSLVIVCFAVLTAGFYHKFMLLTISGLDTLKYYILTSASFMVGMFLIILLDNRPLFKYKPTNFTRLLLTFCYIVIVFTMLFSKTIDILDIITAYMFLIVNYLCASSYILTVRR